MPPYVEVLKALVSLAWPVLTAVVLCLLLPSIKKLIDSRAFTLKFAGIEVTAQEASDQIKAQLQDLKEQVIALKKVSGEPIEPPPVLEKTPPPRSILWVDDKPRNNALEISQLKQLNYNVLTALSTNDAMYILSKEGIGLIFSDMGRQEGGIYVSQAGIILLKAARGNGYKQPFVIYSSAKYAARNDVEVKALGGVGATASPTKLLEWIETYLLSTRKI